MSISKQFKKLGNDVARAEPEIKQVAKETFAVLKALAKGTMDLFTGSLVTFFIVVGLSLLLLTLRHGFLAVAPHIIKHSKRWDIILNGVVDTFVIMEDAIKVVIGACHAAIALFTRHKGFDTSSMFHFKKPPHYSTTQMRDVLLNITVTCANVTSPGEITQLAAKLLIGDKLCPYLRASYPLGTLGQVFRNTSSWASPPSDPLRDNCVEPEGSPTIWCIYLASGMLAFDILVPLLILLIIVGPRGVLKIMLLAVHLVKLFVTLVVGPALTLVMLAVGGEEELQRIAHLIIHKL